MQERKRQEKRKKLTCDNRDDETSASSFPALSTRQKASCRGPGQWGVVSRSFGMDGVKLRCRGIRCKSESHVDPPDRLEGSPTRRWSTTYERQLVVACSNFVHLVAFSFSNEPPPLPTGDSHQSDPDSGSPSNNTDTCWQISKYIQVNT